MTDAAKTPEATIGTKNVFDNVVPEMTNLLESGYSFNVPIDHKPWLLIDYKTRPAGTVKRTLGEFSRQKYGETWRGYNRIGAAIDRRDDTGLITVPKDWNHEEIKTRLAATAPCD